MKDGIVELTLHIVAFGGRPNVTRLVGKVLLALLGNVCVCAVESQYT